MRVQTVHVTTLGHLSSTAVRATAILMTTMRHQLNLLEQPVLRQVL